MHTYFYTRKTIFSVLGFRYLKASKVILLNPQYGDTYPYSEKKNATKIVFKDFVCYFAVVSKDDFSDDWTKLVGL